MISGRIIPLYKSRATLFLIWARQIRTGQVAPKPVEEITEDFQSFCLNRQLHNRMPDGPILTMMVVKNARRAQPRQHNRKIRSKQGRTESRTNHRGTPAGRHSSKEQQESIADPQNQQSPAKQTNQQANRQTVNQDKFSSFQSAE